MNIIEKTYNTNRKIMGKICLQKEDIFFYKCLKVRNLQQTQGGEEVELSLNVL